MATDSKTTDKLPKLRTFAHDLEINRGISNTPKNIKKDSEAITKPTSSEPVQKTKNNNPPDIKLLPKITLSSNRSILKSDGSTTVHNPKGDTNPKKSSAITSAKPKKVTIDILSKPTNTSNFNSLSSSIAKTINNSSQKDISRDASYGATIITDTKRKRFRLSYEIIKSLRNWWNNKIKKYSERKKPKYTIPQTERRKGIIQKATSKTGRVTNIDHAAVLERIKANKKYSAELDRELDASNAEKPKGHNKLTRISATPTPPTPPTKPAVPVIERAVKLEESEVISPSITTISDISPKPILEEKQSEESSEKEYTDREIAEPKEVLNTFVSPVLEEEQIEERVEENYIDEKEVGDYEVQPENSEILPILNETEIETELQPISILPDVIVPTLPESITKPERTKTTKKIKSNGLELISALKSDFEFKLIFSQIRSLFSLFKPIQNPNQLVLVTLIAVTGIFVTYVGINSITQSDKSKISVGTTDTAVMFSTAVKYNEAISDANKTAIFAQLQTKNNPEESVTEIVLLTPDGKKEVTATVLLPALDFILDSDFVASISHVSFGFYRGNPWIVLNSNNHTTAIGGMLRWETTISSDFDPLFGPAVRSAKGSSLTGFKDTTITSIDVRTLLDNNNQERITYGFLTPNTILITTDTTAFINLANNFTGR